MPLATTVAGSVLRIGSQGDVVRDLQLALARLGYKLKGTGYFGGATDTAVSDFQRNHGLKVDGEVGHETAHAIDVAQPVSDKPVVRTPGTDRPLWLIEGLKWINTKEAGNNPEILEWAKEEGGSIAKNYTNTGIAWCALYQNMILTKVGLKGTETLWALDFAGKWPSVKLDGPAIGAFAPMKRPGGGHVINIVGKDQHGNVMGLGGNQSDQVSIVPFPVGRLNQGFWWPKDVTLPARTGMASLPLVRSDGRVSAQEG